jgi:hypothetical protein
MPMPTPTLPPPPTSAAHDGTADLSRSFVF